jgi:DNA replication protein DnaC
MAYPEEILSRAQARLKARQEKHRQERAALREQIYQAIPRTREIDRQLRQTAPRVLALSLRQGLDGQAALAALRKENLSLQDEEARLLYEGGFPDDALNDLPLCPLCSDRGWQGARMCSCLQELCRQEQIKSLSSLLDLGNQSFETFRLDYYDRAVWPEHKRSPREIMEVIFTACRNYADQFPGYPRKNLFLTGAPGLGKTFLSACIARVVSEKGFSVVYDTAGNIFSRFEARKFARGEEEAQTASADARRYLRCDLLILDDLGSEFTTPFVQSALYEIVNTRLVEGKHTILSSNLSLAAIRQRYSPQVASRLEGEYQLLPFVGQDIRQLKRS